jgi:hypothetical protein
MKYLDDVKVIKGRPEYSKEGVEMGMEGIILMAEIRYGTFEIVFPDEDGADRNFVGIRPEDLEVIRSSDLTDEEILNSLPNHDPRWWCKVKDGFIVNLNGEKKNKIAYDYDS